MFPIHKGERPLKRVNPVSGHVPNNSLNKYSAMSAKCVNEGKQLDFSVRVELAMLPQVNS